MLLSISNEYYDLSENKRVVLEGVFLDWAEIDEVRPNRVKDGFRGGCFRGGVFRWSRNR